MEQGGRFAKMAVQPGNEALKKLFISRSCKEAWSRLLAQVRKSFFTGKVKNDLRSHFEARMIMNQGVNVAWVSNGEVFGLQK
jgi:hypothetical protein